MRKHLVIVTTLVAVGLVCFLAGRHSEAGSKGDEHLSHDVYFALKDKKNTQKLVQACQKYLKSHPGEVFFAAGPRAAELKREVNDQDFDVALHIVFKDMAAHEQYQDAPRHKQFIDENKDDWAKVRVFDSYVSR